MDHITSKIFFLYIISIKYLLLISTFLLFNGHHTLAKGEVSPQPSASLSTNDTLQKIILSKQSLRKRIAEEEKNLKKEKTETQQEAIRVEIQEITSRIQALDKDFERIVSGVDLEGFSTTTENIDWDQELRELLSPILEEIKKMTARPREMEALRKQMALYEKRILLTDYAIKNMQQHLAENDSEIVHKELNTFILARQQHYDELEARLAVAQQQLAEREQSNGSIFSSITAVFQDFFKSRGLNFIFALSAFFVIFLLMREAQRLAYKRTRLGRLGEHRSFLLRLSVIIYYLLTFLVALSSFILVLYLSGDWVLLGLAFLFLFGVFWTSKHTLPKFWEQAKLLLNISTVREGERIVYQGLPWRVMALNIYTRLHNPDLRGGMVRLPLSDLIGLESRPFYVEEPWFPTKTEDLVELSDGTIGTIALQTPEQVVLNTRGGAHKTYNTLTFLGLNPINYSVNTFAVFTDFGIDYSCQSDITQTIPDLLHAYITDALKKKGYGTDLLELIVDFKEAAASSLNLLIFSKFSGNQASNYFALSRFLQQAAVDACSAYGWGIPFPQVTLHHPEKAKVLEEQDL
jgi:hypothetical protein